VQRPNEKRTNSDIYKTLRRKVKIYQHKLHKKSGMNSGAPELGNNFAKLYNTGWYHVIPFYCFF